MDLMGKMGTMKAEKRRLQGLAATTVASRVVASRAAVKRP